MILEDPARAEHDIPSSGIMAVTTKGRGSHMAYAWTALRVFCQCSHQCTSTHAPALASRRASSVVFEHNHARIFSGTHKQKFSSPYINPSPLRPRESPCSISQHQLEIHDGLPGGLGSRRRGKKIRSRIGTLARTVAVCSPDRTTSAEQTPHHPPTVTVVAATHLLATYVRESTPGTSI